LGLFLLIKTLTSKNSFADLLSLTSIRCIENHFNRTNVGKKDRRLLAKPLVKTKRTFSWRDSDHAHKYLHEN
jgi:hypothetical protein